LRRGPGRPRARAMSAAELDGEIAAGVAFSGHPAIVVGVVHRARRVRKSKNTIAARSAGASVRLGITSPCPIPEAPMAITIVTPSTNAAGSTSTRTVKSIPATTSRTPARISRTDGQGNPNARKACSSQSWKKNLTEPQR
jgi:hypothetical protein